MTGSLAIDRFRIVALASGDHPDPGRMRHAIGRVDQDRLVRSIGAALGDFGAGDERVIVLRRLDILGTETRVGDADRLAGQLAEGVRTALARLSEASPCDTVVAFRSPAARLAAFVVAAARGDAWGKWWFSDLDHLKLLPVSSAIRVALGRDPAIGLEALATLAGPDRAAVCGMLSQIEAGQLLDDFESILSEDDSEDVWVHPCALAILAHDWPAMTVVLHQLATLAGELEAPPSRGALRAFLAIADLRRSGGVPALVAAMRTGLVATRDLQPVTIAAIANLRPGTRGRLADALMAATPDAPARAERTRFGGILLLWAHLPRLPLDPLPDGPGPGASLLGLLALSALFGADEAGIAIDDPVLRQLLGIDPRATLDDLAGWLDQIAPRLLPAPGRKLQGSRLPAIFSTCPEQGRRVREMGLIALEDFARRLPRLSAASLAFLRDNVFDIGARVTVDEAGARAVLDRPPLDVLLSISGLADRAVALPCGRMLTLERDR